MPPIGPLCRNLLCGGHGPHSHLYQLSPHFNSTMKLHLLPALALVTVLTGFPAATAQKNPAAEKAKEKV